MTTDVRIEGYISKKALKGILNNWQEVGAKKVDFSGARHGNPVKSDGVSGSRINKIMIKQALENIPDKKVQYCAYARWIYQIPVGRTLDRLNIAKTTYYKYCEDALDFIYTKINGERAGVKSLLNEILK